MKIIFTGGSGRFGKKFRDKTKLKNISYPSSKEMNITDYNSIKKYLSKHKPKIVIHCAALSRPMDIHDRQINKSIDIKKNFTNGRIDKSDKIINFQEFPQDQSNWGWKIYYKWRKFLHKIKKFKIYLTSRKF